MVSADDVQLIHSILAGDDEAFNVLVQKYQKSIHALVWRKIGDFHHAEEVTQDTFFQAYKKLTTLKDPRQFSGWLYVIANRLCVDWIRKQKPTMQSLDGKPLKEIDKSAYARYISEKQEREASERRYEIVEQLLSKLPKSERTVMELHYLDEMKTEEIGKFLGVSVNTILSRLHRARKRLQTDEPLQVQEIFGGVQMSENRIENIKQQIASFREHTKSDPFSGEDILTAACNQVEDALKDEITTELVHLADEIYEYMGNLGLEKSVSLHRRYLNVASDTKERFWSHRQLSGGLAMLGQNREAIEEQVRLYRWTCEHLSDEYVLKTLSTLNHTGCWEAEGRIDEWFQLYDAASERLEKPELSRYARCDFLQIGSEILRAYGRLDETLLGMEKLERSNGEPDWEHYFRFWLAVRTNRLLVYSRQGDWDRFEQTLTEVHAFIDEQLEKRDAGHAVDLGNLAWAAHDVGCCLVWEKKYNEAKRLLQIAIDLQNINDYGHFMLAVSTWASENNREKTLHHLKVAQDIIRNSWNRGTYYQTFLGTPEFADVKDDQEFLEALGQK